jgi:hypothetical protein
MKVYDKQYVVVEGGKIKEQPAERKTSMLVDFALGGFCISDIEKMASLEYMLEFFKLLHKNEFNEKPKSYQYYKQVSCKAEDVNGVHDLIFRCVKGYYGPNGIFVIVNGNCYEFYCEHERKVVQKFSASSTSFECKKCGASWTEDSSG